MIEYLKISLKIIPYKIDIYKCDKCPFRHMFFLINIGEKIEVKL